MAEPTRELIGIASIARLAFAGADLAPIASELIDRIARDPGDAAALFDLSTILLTKDKKLALQAQADALRTGRHYRLRAATAERLRLLVLLAPGDIMANTPIEYLVEGSDVTLEILYLDPDGPIPTELPRHDVTFVAIGESDRTRGLLERLGRRMSSWPTPVVNAPDKILNMSRDAACAALAGIPGIDLPSSVRVARATLESVARGERTLFSVLGDGEWPVICRPVGSHMGSGLCKLDSPDAMAAWLACNTEPEAFIARFVDASGSDGQFRKIRIVLIDGHAYACHLAISESWIVHYQTAGMNASPSKRNEEERFMASFDVEFAHRHDAALREIDARIGLDYLGIDCAETADGKLLIFEIDNAMLVHAMDPVELYPYKLPQMRRVFEAFRQLLGRAAEKRS